MCIYVYESKASGPNRTRRCTVVGESVKQPHEVALF